MKKNYISLSMSPVEAYLEGMICGSDPALKETVDPLVNKNADATTLENFEISF